MYVCKILLYAASPSNAEALRENIIYSLPVVEKGHLIDGSQPLCGWIFFSQLRVIIIIKEE